MDLQLEGRVALVTGASAGIGRGIALALAREGARLALVARREALLAEVAEAITGAGGVEPLPVVQDMAAPGACERIARSVEDGLGEVEVLVNNAGTSTPFDLETPDEAWEAALTLSFTRQRQLTERLLRPMMARGWGRVVNITGKSEPDGMASGAMCAKAAVHAWSKGLSNRVGASGVTVNCVAPGRIISEQILRKYTPEYRQWQSENEIPVGEYGQPEDLADLVCFLASTRARYITGTVIPVDGGLRRYQF